MVMGGGGAPKLFQFRELPAPHIDLSREPPEIVYSGGDSPTTMELRGEDIANYQKDTKKSLGVFG